MPLKLLLLPQLKCSTSSRACNKVTSHLQLKPTDVFHPDFENECRECGALPTVVVVDHPVPHTHLCGRHFFADRSMVDWELWNDQVEGTE